MTYRQRLQQLAKELNNMMGLLPAINLELTNEELLKMIGLGMQEYEEGDFNELTFASVFFYKSIKHTIATNTFELILLP